MCGRFSLGKTKEEIAPFLAEYFKLLDLNALRVPRYNVAPGQPVASIIFDGSAYRLGSLQWGLVPSFAKDPNIGFQMINAKVETVFEKPSFRSLISSRRCLILSDGFYEWDQKSGDNRPFFIHMNDQPLFAFAGIYSTWIKPDGTKLNSAAILTLEAEGKIAAIHHRMPVMLTKNQMTHYLRPSLDQQTLLPFFKPCDDATLAMYEVSTLVNSPKNDTAACREAFASTSLKL